MGAKIDAKQYINCRFGFLTVIKPVENKNGNYVVTRCVCGKESEYRLRDLRYGATTSCGCKGITDRDKCIFEKHNNLTIIGLHKEKIWYAICKCDCGNDFIAPLSLVRSDKYVSCGCVQRSKRKSSISGVSKERLYGIWTGIKARCNNPNYHAYKHYGARGIKMCSEWENDYAVFRKWALDLGFKEDALRDEYTVDRKDNDGDYSPDNCRLVSMKVQALNKRSNRLIEHNGEVHPVTEWIRLLGLNRDTVWYRVKHNMTPEQILHKGHLNRK